MSNPPTDGDTPMSPPPTHISPPSSSTAEDDAADISTLESTLFRLASCNDDKLEATLQRLLPKILPLFLRTSAGIREQMLLICNHINKRLNALPELKLPVNELLALYHQHGGRDSIGQTNTGFFITFVLMYIDKGFNRLAPADRISIAHLLLPNLSLRTPTQQRTLLIAFFSSLDPKIYFMERLPAEEHVERWKMIKESKEEKVVILEFMKDVLLWAPILVSKVQQQSIDGVSATATTGASSSSSASGVGPAVVNFDQIPDGLSSHALNVTLDPSLTSSQLQHLKSCCLNFLIADIFTHNEMLPLAIAGSSVGTSEVTHAGENLLKRLKNINLEEKGLIEILFEMYLGTVDQMSTLIEKRRKPVSYGMKLKILNFLTRSKLSVTMIQPALKVIMDTLFHSNSNVRMKNIGLNYVGWFMNHQTNPQHLYTIAPILLNTLLKFLTSCRPTPTSATTTATSAKVSMPTTATTSLLPTSPSKDDESKDEKQTSIGIQYSNLRGQCFALIGLLSLKRPDLFNKNIKILTLFFKSLHDESGNDTTLQSIHEGLSMLRSAYVGMDEKLSDELSMLLLQTLVQSHADRRTRLNVLQCFNRLFPYEYVLARYLCLFSIHDSALEVRDESARGLVPFRPKDELAAERDREKQRREREAREEKRRKEKEREIERKTNVNTSEESKEEAEDGSMESTSPEVVPPSPTPAPALSTPSTSAGSNSLLASLRPIEAAIVPYPSFTSLVSFAAAHILPTGDQLLTSSSDGSFARFRSSSLDELKYLRSSITFEVRALPQLLDYLYDTLKQNALWAIDASGHESPSLTSSNTVSSPNPKSVTGLTEDEIHSIVSQYVAKLWSSEVNAGVPESHRSILLFQSLIEHSLDQRIHDVQSSAAQHLVRLVSLVPQQFAPVYSTPKRLEWVEKNMVSGIQLLRSAMGELLQLIASQLEPDSIISSLLDRFLSTLRTAEKTLGPNRDDATHGSILALGVLTAESMRRNKHATESNKDGLFKEDYLGSIVMEILKRLDTQTLTRTPHITAASIISIGRIGEVGPLPIPTKTVDGDTATSTSTSASYPQSRDSLVATLFSFLRGSERKPERVVEESIKTLSLLSMGDITDSELLNQIVDRFFQTVNTKWEEIHFAVGEALTTMAKKHQHPISNHLEVMPPRAAGMDENKMDIVPFSSSSSVSSSSASAGSFISPHSDLLASILPRLFKLISHGSSLQRTGAVTWLLCIVKYGWNLEAVTLNFDKIQSAFSIALTDSNQFVQEVAAKGMSVLFEHSTGSVQQQLIDQLMRTFSSGQRKVTGDTQITLDEENGQVSTYKELVEVAKEMNKPDLVYNFLDLAAHHSIWSSKLGAAFSLSSILQVNQKMASQLGTIIPKLYRYQFDTNHLIAASMKKMWLNLVTNPRDAINQHFDAIITDLIESMSNRQYRVRNSSCLALSELLHGRGMDQLSPYLEKLWSYTFRLLDDVNEYVRKSAAQLASVLSHLSIRLCDTVYSNRESAQRALSIVIPVLLQQGVTAKAKEIQSVSIKALLAIIKIGGHNLRPHLPSLLHTLLETLSSLEPAVFSYLQFHVHAMNMTDEQLERARLHMASGGVLADAIASCLLVVDEDSVPPILAKLTEIIQNGLGLPTLTAAAKFAISLVNSKVAPAMRDHVVPILNALMKGLSDQSPTLRKVYADAIGYLCKIAKKKRVEKLLTSLIDMYMSEKSSETSRLIAGFALRSIVRQAGDTIRTNFMIDLVPIAFLGSHDNTPGNVEIQKVWMETYEELVPGLDAGVVLYMKECAEVCRKLLDSPVYALRHIALLTLKHLILACKIRFVSELPSTLPVVEKLLPGRLWSGKEVALDVLAFAAQECGSKMTAQQARGIVSALVAEIDRNKTDYKREAIRCVGKCIACFPYLNEKETILPVKERLQPILELNSDSNKNDEKKDNSTSANSTSASASSSSDDTASKGPDPLLITYTYGTLGELLPSPQQSLTSIHSLHALNDPSAYDGVEVMDWYEAQRHHSEWILESLIDGLDKGFNWTVRVAILVAIKRFFQHLYDGAELEPATGGSSHVLPKRSYGASLVEPSLVGKLVTAILKPTVLEEPKYPLVRARAMEVLQQIADRPNVWSSLVDRSNHGLIESLHSKLVSMRSDTEATVLRLGPTIQHKLAQAL